MRILYVCCCAFAAGAAAPSQPVDELVRTAIERNRELQAVRQRILEARGELRQAGVRPAPAVEADAATGRPLGTAGEEEFSIAYSLAFETAGKRGKRIRAGEKSVALAEAELADHTRRLAARVKIAHAEAVSAQRRVAVFGRLIDLHRASLRLVEARVEQGDAAPLESKLLAVELSRAEAQRAAAAGRHQAALAELRSLCGLTVDEPLVPAEAFALGAERDFSVEALWKLALAERPDLRAARLREELATAGAELIAAEGKPDVAVTARYAHRTSSFDQYGYTRGGALEPLRDRDNVLSFGVSVPILTSRRNQGNLEAAAARVAGAKSMRAHLTAAIPLEVLSAWQRWNASRQSLAVLKSGVIGQSEDNLSVIRQAYALGELRLLDVLNEQRRLLDTQLAFIDAEAETAGNWIALEQAVGGEIR